MLTPPMASLRPRAPLARVVQPLAVLAVALALLVGPARVARAATITVNTTTDEFGSGASCSLREAIQSANLDLAFGGCTAGAGDDTIILAAGTYLLTIANSAGSENFNLSGDLDLTTNITLSGAGATATIIDGNGGTLNDRVLHIIGSPTVALSGLTIQNGSISANGGGIQNSGTLTLADVAVANNTAVGFNAGGGVFNLGTLTVVNSTISNNSAGLTGGGIYTNVGAFTATNSTISSNAATSNGGGLHADGGTVNLNNVTVTQNSTGGDGGGVSAIFVINFRNTILAGNTDTSGANSPDCVGLLNSGDYNLVGSTGGCTIFGAQMNNQVGVSPMLGPLQNNGGQTETHALLAGSPAIDGGNTAGCTDSGGNPITSDQRGVARPLDGDGDGTATCDIGAYEAPTAATPTPSSTPTPTPTNTVGPSPTPTPTSTIGPSPTPTPTPLVPPTVASPTPMLPPPTSPPGPGPGPFSTPVGGQGVGSAGGPFLCDGWTVTIPAQTVPDGSTVHCGPFNPNFAPPAPSGHKLLGHMININIYDPGGSWITTFTNPLAFCYRYGAADLAAAKNNTNNLVVLTGQISVTWTALTTTVNATTQQACGSTNHLTLFELSARTSAGAPLTYVVQPGDNLFRIALRFNTTVSALQAANGLRSWLIYAGQVLIIPGGSAPLPGPATGVTTYVVQPGDNLFRIALRFNTTVSALQAANGLNSILIYVGQTLRIPVSAPAPTAPPPPPATSLPSVPGTYVVQPGDNLFRIALRFNTTVAALQAANGLSSIYIYVGQVLVIPGGGAAPPSSLARPNGPLILAARRTTAPQIDGHLGEWTLGDFFNRVVHRPGNWAGNADQSATFALAWDATHLYLAVALVDDVHVQTRTGSQLYLGDSLEVLLDADLGGDFNLARLSEDDYQIGLSPGASGGGGPETYLWFPAARAGSPAGITVAARRIGEGFQLEAAIPWSLFNLAPAAGARYGFALSASDNDTPNTADQQSMVSTVATRRLEDPTTWGTLVLNP